MKKLLLTVSAAALLCGCTDNSGIFFNESSEVSEEAKLTEASEEDFEYAEENGSIILTKYIGSMTEFAVPETLDGKPVVEIGGEAFCKRADILKVEIPDTVVKIGKNSALKFREGEDISGDVILTGADVEKANVYYDTYSCEHIVQLEFTPSGAEKFAEATERLSGGQISIWVDGELLSAPYVHERITAGMATISGNFSPEEVWEIAEKINGNPFEGCEKIRVAYKGKTYGYNELSGLYSAVEANE